MPRLLFNLAKGLLYGSAVGLFFALAIFLVATSVVGLGFLTISPILLGGLIFANGIMSGVSYEYGLWLKLQKDAGLLFRLALGFLQGVTVGLYFGTAIFLVATAVAGLGFLVGVTPLLLGGLIFAVMILAHVGKEYDSWLDEEAKRETESTPK
jgi:hypothetical protein